MLPTKQVFVGKGIVVTTEVLELEEMSKISKIMQTFYVDTLNIYIQRLSTELRWGCNVEGYILERDHTCHVGDEDQLGIEIGQVLMG